MKDLEIFIPIKDMDGYMVSNHYRILSLRGDKPKFLKPSKKHTNHCYNTSYNGKKVLLYAEHLWYLANKNN